MKGGITLLKNIKSWWNNIKKKFNKPELLMNVFYGMTILVIIN